MQQKAVDLRCDSSARRDLGRLRFVLVEIGAALFHDRPIRLIPVGLVLKPRQKRAVRFLVVSAQIERSKLRGIVLDEGMEIGCD